MENNDSAVESFDWLSATAQSFGKVQLHQHVQIAASPRENIVLHLIQNNDNVAWLQTNFLVTLSIEGL
jgi:hypothetical protein